ncbi:hypothetical protein [Microcoleus sp. PH2017_18_LLB_O_A]|uniref:hypothetical protein n=2 Tax=Microcoleus TaxID=44471 RepID=UPI001DC6198C|nr:hypothetical protein [Microcoleus sp. PH2017_18_LLB_O_A]MCC3515200.1 hypothetical protein [Microcoleus sp. PH2017_18_LLB_O_A]
MFAICAFEMGGDLGGCPFAALSAEQVADGPKLLFQGFGERLLFRRGDRDFCFGYDTCKGWLDVGFAWGLVVGTQPANVSVAFFFGALGVEGDEVFEDLVVGEGCFPIIGGKDGAIEFVVDLFEGGD